MSNFDQKSCFRQKKFKKSTLLDNAQENVWKQQ